jgi:hypothetical protein
VEVEMARGARYRLLAVLYGSQFVPLAFCLFALTVILRDRGGALERRRCGCRRSGGRTRRLGVVRLNRLGAASDPRVRRTRRIKPTPLAGVRHMVGSPVDSKIRRPDYLPNVA